MRICMSMWKKLLGGMGGSSKGFGKKQKQTGERSSYSEITTRIKKNEGFSLVVYYDSEGLPTIGWGHLLPKDTSIDEITQAKADRFFTADFATAIKDAESFQYYEELPIKAQDVMIDLCFNLGFPRLALFVKFHKYMNEGRFGLAAIELLDSKYAQQVKGRAFDNAKILVQLR